MYDNLIESLRLCVKYGKAQDALENAEQAADAIEELTGFVQEAECDRDEYRERLDKANDAIEELMRRCEQFQYMPPPAWIPVTERLPKEEETVLAFGTLGVAWLDWRHDNKWCCYGGVTHWMPLPEPPKEET